MDDIVEKVKEVNRIEDVIEEMGYSLQRRQGKYIRARDHDSLVINTHNQTYTWNSKNEIQGDVIEWVMRRNGWDFKTVVEWLARRAHMPEPRWRQEDEGKRELRRKREKVFALAQVAMQRWLWDDAEALGYARGRGWTDETIREAGLGFSGRRTAAALVDLRGDFSLHEIDPESPEAVAILGFQGDVRRWAEKWEVDISQQPQWVEWGRVVGITGKTRLVYPHYVNGRVQTFSGRNILGAEINKEGREVKAYNLPVILAGSRHLFFNHAYSTRAETCVLVEGQADAITLGQWGIAAVALIGTGWQDQKDAIEEMRKRHPRLYLGMDADEAGLKAVQGRDDEWEMAFVTGPMCRMVRWPESQGPEGKIGKDANDWLRWGMAALGLTDYQGEIEEREPLIDLTLNMDADELLNTAIEIAQSEGRLSQTMLQRRLRIGYPRAVKIVETLTGMGLVRNEGGKTVWVGQPAAAENKREGGPGREAEEDAKPKQETEEIRRLHIQRLVERQAKKAREWLESAPTMAEVVAEWAGAQRGGGRDDAFRIAFRLIGAMDKAQIAMYLSSLVGRLDIGVREFNNILKATGKELAENELAEIIETLGGYIQGWLVEYLYDPETDKALLAYRDPDRKMGVAESIEIEGKRYIPQMPTNFIRDGGVLFPSEIGPQKSTRELVAIIEMFVNQHYLLENKYLSRTIAYYVLLTWMYDSFNAICYLRAMGEAGAGKSELMRRVGHLCYRMITASGASTAATLFRVVEMFKGTVFIDEADLHDGGDMSNMIVKFLNQGAMKGTPIQRLTERMSPEGKFYEVENYQTYGPKLIAMRKDFKDDAVASRSLTIKLMPREPIELKAKGIKLQINSEFRDRARAIRNLLLRWRLSVWEPEIEISDDLMDLEISSRLNQVTMPIKALAKDDPELLDEITKFLRALNADLVLSRSMTIAARIVEALWRIHNTESLREKYIIKTADNEGEMILIGDVAKVANDIIDEMNALGEGEIEEDESAKRKRKRDSLTARGVGSLIRNELQLQVGERRGKGFPVYWDQIKLEALAKRYGVDQNTKAVIVDLNVKTEGGQAKTNSAQVGKQDEIPF